jgi:hypothetical protein
VVNAGMSIGFYTDIHEVKLVTKAFTIMYVLLGASVTGGALALFIQDAVEGLSTAAVQENQEVYIYVGRRNRQSRKHLDSESSSHRSTVMVASLK